MLYRTQISAVVIDKGRFKSGVKNLVPGILAFLTAVPMAFLVHYINTTLPDSPEKAVQIVAGIFMIILIFPPAAYLISRRASADPARLGLIVITTVSVLLISIYLYRVSFYISFPADILVWSESDFVNDILKFRVGYPLYSAEANNESFTYVPGTQLLTYFLAWLLGDPTSIPVYRMIQFGFTLIAVGLAVLCCYRLIELSLPDRKFQDQDLWSVLLFPIFFLIATNSLTNPFVYNLHNDSLALLVSVMAFWLLLEYVMKRDKRLLILMAILPGIGFLIKQNLVIWAFLYSFYLVFFDRPRSMARLIAFVLAAFGGIGVTIGGCYLLWGEHFIYWVFTVLGKHEVSLLRSFQHILDVWPYLAIGLLGGLVLLRGKKFSFLLGPWLIWLFLILNEIYTSGIAWMLNHLGPGCLIAGVWFLAALVKIWPLGFDGAIERSRASFWLHASMIVVILGLLFNGLGVIRIPTRPLPEDAYRYVKEIESEFQDESAELILLDVGTWIYLKDGVIMKDRAPSIGERGYSEAGDFSGIIRRLNEKRYSKILVRRLDFPDFWYDYWLWGKSSQIKRTLLENYQEVRKIKGVTIVDGEGLERPISYTFAGVSILVPKSTEDLSSGHQAS